MIRSIRDKWIWLLGALLMIACAILIYCVNAMLGYPASSTQVSPSGRYVMENVRVGRIFMLGGMGYLRVIDTQEPGKVYRTPLYDTQSLDMRAFENEKEVGVSWIDFDRQEKTFTISMSQWEESWLNIFISNTPYTHLEN
ncbi:hypothetical protein ALQ47_00016 [Pseudomonas cichorii]|nr:hypothetical protein ALQ47_00016 [Pseudomonas cichorii]